MVWTRPAHGHLGPHALTTVRPPRSGPLMSLASWRRWVVRDGRRRCGGHGVGVRCDAVDIVVMAMGVSRQGQPRSPRVVSPVAWAGAASMAAAKDEQKQCIPLDRLPKGRVG